MVQLLGLIWGGIYQAMGLMLALIGSFALLLWGTLQGVFIAYPLAGVMAIFLILLMGRGFALAQLLRFAIAGSRRSLPVIQVLLLIGVVIASWMAAGTVPALVYYGLQWVHPQTFLLMAFLLTAGVSVLLGTSFGTVGTIGIALMTMAQGSDLNLAWLGGAIIAGAYVGDRASPMSSSALLVASITHTRLPDNLRRMLRTTGWPLLLSSLVYLSLSWFHPIHLAQQTLTTELDQVFHIQPLLLLPAAVILALSLVQVSVMRSMLVSLGVAGAIALTTQHHSLGQLARFLLLGFHLNTQTDLDAILLGGGMMSMLRVVLVVVISTAFVGVFAGTHLLETLQHPLKSRPSQASSRFITTGIVGIGAAAFGCTQTIAILLTEQLVRPKYEESEKGNTALALDLENTVVVLSPLIPWNIAGLVPATILQVGVGFIPFAVYLYLLPVATLLALRRAASTPETLCN